MGASEMYQSHPIFELPADPDTQIWRYMDFTKFLAMLESDSLWFARADRLGDPFEGAYTKPMVEKYYFAKGESKEEKEENDWNVFKASVLNQLTSFYVNCWHINSGESAAMWKQYLKSDEGLAIQSTISRLIECDNKSKETIYIGKVHYTDYNNASFDDTNNYNRILYKRNSYKHEDELRAVIVEDPVMERFFEITADGLNIERLPESDFENHLGVSACNNMIDLIEKIYVAPTSPQWFSGLVSTIAKKYKITCEIETSDLADRPLL